MILKKSNINILIILIIILIIGGCTQTSTQSDNIVNIVQENLFEGDLERIGPHLQFLGTTCVSIDYKGNKSKLGCKYEVWENGELIEEGGTGYKIISNGFKGDISISLKELLNNNLERSNYLTMTSVISDENGYVQSTKYIDRFDDECTSGPFNLQNNINTDNDDEEIPIWVYIADDGDFDVSYSDMQKTAEESTWALLLKVKFAD